MAATTEPLPSMENLEWGKALCSDESIEKWTAANVFRPGELVEWRVPTKDELPSPSIMEKDEFVILSLNHIMCGLRVDASDFLVSVLKHYGIEWSHLTPNSITVLSIFTHLCEAYLGVPPTVEVFAHFYKLYLNNKGETVTLGGVYFRMRDKMKKSYPIYYLKASQFSWYCLWFYAKLPQSCRLTFKGDALKEANNWKDVLILSPEQEKQVRQIEELSNLGLTGVDIVRDYLKHRISPLRQRAYLACYYTGPTDPTRDSDEDFSEEDIESKLLYLLDLKKTGQKEPSRGRNVPTSLIRASADEPDNQSAADLLNVLSTLKAKKKTVEELTDPKMVRKSSDYDSLVPTSPRRYTRQSAILRKTEEPPPPEIDSSPVQGHSDLEDEDIVEARTTITTSASPNRGVEQKSIENSAEIEEGKRAALVKPISSIIGGKRKFFGTRSGSQRKPKYSFISTMAKTRVSSLDSACIKRTSLRKKAAVVDPQSPGSARSSPAFSVQKGEKSDLFMLANVVDQNKVPEGSVSNVLLDQHIRDSPLKDANPAQSTAERVRHQETIEESTHVQVANPGGINSEAIWEKIQKVHNEYVSSSAATLSELLEHAKKLVMENKRLKDEHIMMEQQVKDLEENRRLLTDTMRKAEQAALKRLEENTKLKDDIRESTQLCIVQKKMIDELSKEKESAQLSLVQKCTEVNCLQEEAAVLKEEKKALQARVSRANELLKIMTTTLHPLEGEGEENRAS
ncbi:unnamed protein product [Urochloa decumbens]|uniref:Transposase (putative) gypsy type domain-containing protein n=1 Tax=Urochloa decumbens TaxID=240449 RepID=A0ABC9DB46_9POAL